MPNKGDFGGFKKGFLLDQKKDKKGESSESSKKTGQLSNIDQQLVGMGVDPKKYHEKKPLDQPESSQSGSSKPSSDFGSLKRGFLLKDEPSQSQAPVDQTQSPEAVVQQDPKGKGKQLDQDKGLSRTGESSKQPERLSVQQLQRLTQDVAHLSPHEREQFFDKLPGAYQKQLTQHLKLTRAMQEVQSHQNRSEIEAIITKYQEINASRDIDGNDRIEYAKEMQRAYSTEYTKVGQSYASKITETDEAYEASSENPEGSHMSEGDYIRTVNMLRDKGNEEQSTARMAVKYAKMKIRNLTERDK